MFYEFGSRVWKDSVSHINFVVVFLNDMCQS